jgi:hypothetical protein
MWINVKITLTRRRFFTSFVLVYSNESCKTSSSIRLVFILILIEHLHILANIIFLYINFLKFRLDFWSEIRTVYKLSMECMKSYARKSISSKFTSFENNIWKNILRNLRRCCLCKLNLKFALKSKFVNQISFILGQLQKYLLN